jgi:hypothetical protein
LPKIVWNSFLYQEAFFNFKYATRVSALVAESVAALSLAYFLDTGEDWKIRRGAVWEKAFLEAASQLNRSLTNIHISR